MIPALLAAAVGAVAGSAILGLLGALGVDSLWPALGVGLLCGLLMRTLVKHSTRGSYLNGALAALALLAAVVGGKYALAKVLTDSANQTVAMPQAVSTDTASPPGDAATTEDDVDDVSVGQEVAELPRPAPSPQLVTVRQTTSVHDITNAKGMSILDGVWLVVSALIAYQIGKGESMRKQASQAQDTTDDATADKPTISG